MPLFLDDHQPDYRLGVWKMEETTEELWQLLHNPALYESAFARITSDPRRLEWLSVRVLLARLLGEEKVVDYYESGRPFLADGSFQLSISHTKGYVAVLLSRDCRVGVDLEHYRRQVHRVASRFMHPDERLSQTEGDTTWELLTYWSAKESIYKGVDDADADLRQIRIDPFKFGTSGQMVARQMSRDPEKMLTVRYELRDEFVLTWMVLR